MIKTSFQNQTKGLFFHFSGYLRTDKTLSAILWMFERSLATQHLQIVAISINVWECWKFLSKRKIVSGPAFAGAEFAIILIFFLLKFNMPTGKKDYCIFWWKSAWSIMQCYANLVVIYKHSTKKATLYAKEFTQAKVLWLFPSIWFQCKPKNNFPIRCRTQVAYLLL